MIFPNMKEEQRMGFHMVKEQPLSLMEQSMLGNTRMGKGGMEHNTTNTETSNIRR